MLAVVSWRGETLGMCITEAVRVFFLLLLLLFLEFNHCLFQFLALQ